MCIRRLLFSHRTSQDLCVGDFWETQERRAIATFTTPIAVDKFLLVTSAVTVVNAPMFAFPDTFDPSR